MSNSLDFLCVIVDCNPCWWGKLLEEENNTLLFWKILDDLGAFCSVHCLKNPSNQLLMLSASSKPREQCVLFSSESSDGTSVQATIRDRIQETIFGYVADDPDSNDCLETRLAGPLSTSLCYINRFKKQFSSTGRSQFMSRILVVKVGEDVTSQHLNLMSIFAAQKQGVIIDACTLGAESGILQQACDITGGISVHVTVKSALLQYLLTALLPNRADRTKLSAPTFQDVDYRPACFCHQKLISTAWVCSVCLSVFCQFTPICSTCQTVFKFLPAISKPKKQKRSKEKAN